MTHPTGTISRIAANPRNPWSRLLAALDLSERGSSYEAARVLQTLFYKDGLSEDLLQHAGRMIAHGAANDATAVRVNIPSDYNRGIRSMLHPPFRTVSDVANFPKPFPSGLALRPIVGNRNDFAFIEEVANLRAPGVSRLAIDIIHPYASADALQALLKSVKAQEYGGPIRLHIFGESLPTGLHSHLIEVVQHSVPLLSGVAGERLMQIASETDIVFFVSGAVTLEPSLLQRIAHVAAVSDRVVHALIPESFGDGLTPFNASATKKHLTRHYPFRDVNGLNLAVPAAMFRDIGGLNPRFDHGYDAAREMCFRLYNRGCYFRPVATDNVRDFAFTSAADGELFKQLCPNHWDRPFDGAFDIPKVSIYIPAHNAGRYIVRAVESVLDQDVEDLEVCIADDGSRDNTLDLLEQHFSGNPKVRWAAGPNGGIGFASNRAISMARGLYIGQLDSDDRLKPGAVRRLATYLDENPDVACCYASCERVDADGEFLQNEYSWPVFSREKMMVTSIAHHFRMFRKQAWERTEKFREDIINAVDYDMFLKLSEVGNFHHIDEILYQRRWHGANTSNLNESHQTANARRVQREALKRERLINFWDIHVPNADDPRRVTYQRRPGRKIVTFWPYYRANPYQRMLYAPHAEEMEFCAGTIDAALREIRISEHPQDHIFHLHWLNFLFSDEMTTEQAQAAAGLFVSKIEAFKACGGTVTWTIHNTISHEVVYREVEIALSRRLTELADVLHFHSPSSIAEVAEAFPIPQEKVRFARHGHFIGAYPDMLSRGLARQYLGLEPDDDVILFTGQVRAYKGIELLIEAFRSVLAERPNLKLVIAGAARGDPLANLAEPLSPFEQSRLKVVNRYIDDSELQVFLRAGDFAVFPYRKILTSSSLMLALTFELPVIMPDVGMARDALGESGAGILYDGSVAELQSAIQQMLAAKDDGRLAELGKEARRVAGTHDWQRLFEA